MKYRSIITALAVNAAGLLLAGPAVASTYIVNGGGEGAGTCSPSTDADTFNCTDLRGAVTAANASPADDDSVFLPPGTYTLTQGQLSPTSGVSIIGTGPRLTTVTTASTSRVMTIVAGVTNVLLGGLTLKDGFVGSGGRGGTIYNLGELDLFQVAITGGIASGSGATGGAISNYGGDLTIVESLIEGNTATGSGGAISNENSGIAASLHIDDSTLSGNSAPLGGAIVTSAAGNSVALSHVTFKDNFPGSALAVTASGQSVSVSGSIFATNVGSNSNCDSTFKPADDGFNIDTGTGCGFTVGTGSRPSTDPQLSSSLTDAGGPTDLYTIPAGSPAEGLVSPCDSGLDQRGYYRDLTFAACDAGAYEIGGTPIVPAPPTPTAIPTPIAAVQTPVPAATPTPTAAPSQGVTGVSGKVLIRDPKTKQFVPLAPGTVPNGAEIDTRDGKVDITIPSGTADFFGGIFKLSIVNDVATLTLSEPIDCKKAKSSAASAAAKKPKTRKLWGEGKGKFRTKGQYSAATIRGTKWLTTDTCTTTTTKVTEGTVAVADLVTKKTIVVRKGKSYVARAKRK